jgi:hypothetical protein
MKLDDFWAYAPIRRFISGFANVAKPLTKLTEPNQSFQWTPDVEATIQTPKGALCTAPTLAYPQPGESVAPSPNPHKGETAKASILVGRPIHGSHPDK